MLSISVFELCHIENGSYNTENIIEKRCILITVNNETMLQIVDKHILLFYAIVC